MVPNVHYYLMKLWNDINLWISKEHNNFSYLWKFQPNTPMVLEKLSVKNSKLYKECMAH